MIPILLSGTTVKGFLQGSISCTVTEEKNGKFELTININDYHAMLFVNSDITMAEFILSVEKKAMTDIYKYRISEDVKVLGFLRKKIVKTCTMRPTRKFNKKCTQCVNLLLGAAKKL